MEVFGYKMLTDVIRLKKDEVVEEVKEKLNDDIFNGM
jgi:hypothetical protein